MGCLESSNLRCLIFYLITSNIFNYLHYSLLKCLYSSFHLYMLCRTNGYKGNKYINRQLQNQNKFLNKSSYILQDDHLNLIVLELIEIVSKVRNFTMRLNIHHQTLVRIVYTLRSKIQKYIMN